MSIKLIIWLSYEINFKMHACHCLFFNDFFCVSEYFRNSYQQYSSRSPEKVLKKFFRVFPDRNVKIKIKTIEKSDKEVKLVGVIMNNKYHDVIALRISDEKNDLVLNQDKNLIIIQGKDDNYIVMQNDIMIGKILHQSLLEYLIWIMLGIIGLSLLSTFIFLPLFFIPKF